MPTRGAAATRCLRPRRASSSSWSAMVRCWRGIMPLEFHMSLAVILRVALTCEANSSYSVGSCMNFGRKFAPLRSVERALRPFRLIQNSFLAVKLWLLLSAPWRSRSSRGSSSHCRSW